MDTVFVIVSLSCFGCPVNERALSWLAKAHRITNPVAKRRRKQSKEQQLATTEISQKQEGMFSLSKRRYRYTYSCTTSRTKIMHPVLSEKAAAYCLSLHYSAVRLFLLRADTAQAPRTASRDQSDLLTGRRETVGGRRVTDVLVVTTTEGVLHRVHRHTTHVGPLITLHAVPVNSDRHMGK